MEKVAGSEELKASIENQLDSDGNISLDTLITLGAEHSCEFTAEDLTQNAELSDEELEGVAGRASGLPTGKVSGLPTGKLILDDTTNPS